MSFDEVMGIPEVGLQALAGQGDGGKTAERHAVPHVQTVDYILHVILKLLKELMNFKINYMHCFKNLKNLH